MDMVTDFGIESLRVGSYEARKALVGCDDWKLSMLRDKRQEARERIAKALYAALASQAQPEQPKQDSVHLTSDAVVCAATRALPHPGSPEASAMLDSLLAEYNYPANPKNAARAGWEAANRWLAPGPADTDRARSDEKESVAALPVQQWQPISTAPKDGSPVFLWLPELHGWREGPWRGSWSITEKQWTVHAPFAIGDKAVQFTALPAPTHWSALPPPPVDQGEQQ
jgi:hypothetical protein